MPIFFLLAIEPLARMLRNNPMYKGITIQSDQGEIVIKENLFADDLCFAIG